MYMFLSIHEVCQVFSSTIDVFSINCHYSLLIATKSNIADIHVSSTNSVRIIKYYDHFKLATKKMSKQALTESDWVELIFELKFLCMQRK